MFHKGEGISGVSEEELYARFTEEGVVRGRDGGKTSPRP